jgi:hypothetical protein
MKHWRKWNSTPRSRSGTARCLPLPWDLGGFRIFPRGYFAAGVSGRTRSSIIKVRRAAAARFSSMRAMQCCGFPTEPQWTLQTQPKGGIVMDVENTDLERRVLAHDKSYRF